MEAVQCCHVQRPLSAVERNQLAFPKNLRAAEMVEVATVVVRLQLDLH